MTLMYPKILASLCAGIAFLLQTLSPIMGPERPLFWVVIFIAAVFAALSIGLLNGSDFEQRGKMKEDGHHQSPVLGVWSIGLFLGAVLYLLYQLVFIILGYVTGMVFAATGFGAMPNGPLALVQIVSIASPLIMALFGLVLGLTVLSRSPRYLAITAAACVSFLCIVVAVQGLFLALGSVSHLEIINVPSVTIAIQGLLLVWAIIAGSLISGTLIGVLARTAKAKFGR